jgi:hypothetical protein
VTRPIDIPVTTSVDLRDYPVQENGYYGIRIQPDGSHKVYRWSKWRNRFRRNAWVEIQPKPIQAPMPAKPKKGRVT